MDELWRIDMNWSMKWSMKCTENSEICLLQEIGIHVAWTAALLPLPHPGLRILRIPIKGSTDLPCLRSSARQSCDLFQSSKGRLDMDFATKTTLKQKQLMAIWCFKCTNDSRQSFTLRTWLVQSAFSSSFQRASACSGGKNQFRLGQTWMKIRQRTMQNSWFYMFYQYLSMSSGHLIAVVFLDFLPSQPECQVGPRNEPASNMSNLSQVSLNILQSVGVCLQPIKSRCLQTKQPKFKQTHHC